MATASSNVSRGTLSRNDQAAIDVNRIRVEDQKTAFSEIDENILKSYSNVTYRWTMAPLTPLQVTELRAGNPIQPQNIVICSGGGQDANRVSTFYGSPEYFIDNVEINTFATPTKASGLSGNLTMNFEVIEPYSLGLFIQSLQSAAYRSKYNNYLECTWLMQVEFLGNDVSGKQTIIPTATRQYTQRLSQVSFTATEAGSKYQVRTLDFNLEAFNNVYGTYFGAANVEAATVGDALTNLATVLNIDQQIAKAKGVIQVADKYNIIVRSLEPNDEATTTKIQQSKFAAADSSEKVSGSNKETQKNDTKTRGAPVFGPRKFTFSPLNDGRRIVDMIQEILVSSEFCVKATQPENVDKKTGYVTWYRISAALDYLGSKFQNDSIQNRPAYEITFVVTPYRVHHSVMKTPLASSLGMRPDEIIATIKKRYDYLYTGLNDDIVRWELKFDNTFYTSIPSQPNTNARDSSGVVVDTPVSSNTAPSTQEINTITHSGRLLRDKKGSYRKPIGGGTADDDDIRTARAFEQGILQDTEMIMVNMTILGDPYYLTRSGAFLEKVGPEAPGAQINNDRTMATEAGEVRIFLRFRTPIDAPTPGSSLFIFPSDGFADSPFGGLYKVRSVKSKFSEGVFTQDLDLFRDRGQQPEEIKTIRNDPSILFGSAIIVDPRSSSYGETPSTQPSEAVTTPLAPPSTIVGTPIADVRATLSPGEEIDPLDEFLKNKDIETQKQRQIDKNRIDDAIDNQR
jgi:hypothetical protein